MADWQPIETAPTDGTECLIAIPEYGTGPGVALAVASYHKGEWKEHPDDDDEDGYHSPTHWMPLPDPPQTER